jgi:hypothetical protein
MWQPECNSGGNVCCLLATQQILTRFLRMIFQGLALKSLLLTGSHTILIFLVLILHAQTVEAAQYILANTGGSYSTLDAAEAALNTSLMGSNNILLPGEKLDLFRMYQTTRSGVPALKRDYWKLFMTGAYYAGPKPTGSAVNCASWPVPSWDYGTSWVTAPTTKYVLGTDCWQYKLSRYYRHQAYLYYLSL